jgi:ATP-binding cassette subfamily C protein EexD
MTNSPQSQSRYGADTAPELRAVMAASRKAVVTAALFSLFMNLLLLVPSLYMLQVYDRVLSTGSVPTLLMLTLIATFLFIVFGGLEWLRSQVMIVASMRFDAMLGPTIHDAIFARTLATAGRQASAQPLEDLDKVRQFITGPGLFALLDSPWVPVYVVIMFVFHPWMGAAALFSMAVLAVFTVWTEMATGHLLQEANRANIAANQQTAAHLRNAEAIAAMGMLPSLRERWLGERNVALDAQHRASARAGLISAMSKTYRLTSQSLILGLGAYLAIKHEISAGMVIAGSILLGRALSPIDQLIGSWKTLTGARIGYSRLSELLKAHPQPAEAMTLPAIRGEFRIEKLVISPPGVRRPVIKEISLQIPAGSQMAVIGPSAAGKSTFLRALLGLHRPVAGSLRLDAIELAQYARSDLGRSIGYLPQDVELLDGTIAENIARFGFIDPEAVVKAARCAGVHEMIGAMPDGYETRLHGNFTLSAGQRQRVALARALYGDPAVVILDEPNSNLDEAGNAALQQALAALRTGGTTVVVVTHRPQLLEQMDSVLVLVEGRISCFGTPSQVADLLQQRRQAMQAHAAGVNGSSPPAQSMHGVNGTAGMGNGAKTSVPPPVAPAPETRQ